MDEKDLKQLLDSVVTETRRHFDVVAEAMDKKIQFFGEALILLGEELRRDNHSLREDLNRGFADTQAMIKFSHAP